VPPPPSSPPPLPPPSPEATSDEELVRGRSDEKSQKSVPIILTQHKLTFENLEMVRWGVMS
jgi:hypothetical protein